MATITLDPNAVTADGPISFSFPGADFKLEANGSFESSAPEVVAAASQHPWLKVEVDTSAAAAPVAVDLTDPHQNRAADHLASEASPEAVKAAEDAQAKIAAANAGEASAPTVIAPVAQPEPSTPSPVSLSPAPVPSSTEVSE